MRKYRFDSEIWWPPIEELAQKFVIYINKQSNEGRGTLEYKRLEMVKDTYYKNMTFFKKRIYGKDANKNRIDRHKIIALYIKSFLEISPFYVKNHNSQNHSKVLACPNEYFSLHLMYLILTAWNKKEFKNNMEETERKWFIILLNHFKLSINTLDILSLAQIIYYIEDKYIGHTDLA